MAYTHTTPDQDRTIRDAQSAPTAEDLISIISSLDERISEWKDETGSDDPRTVANQLRERAARIEELEGALAEARKLQ